MSVKNRFAGRGISQRFPWESGDVSFPENRRKNCGRQNKCFVLYYSHRKTPVLNTAGERRTQGILEENKQKEILQKMLDAGFAGGCSVTELRDRLGIDPDTWEALLREGGVPGMLVSLSKSMAEMCAPWVWASLLEQTKDGSVPAMKLYFELCREKQAETGSSSGGSAEILALRQEIFGRQGGDGA